MKISKPHYEHTLTGQYFARDYSTLLVKGKLKKFSKEFSYQRKNQKTSREERLVGRVVPTSSRQIVTDNVELAFLDNDVIILQDGFKGRITSTEDVQIDAYERQESRFGIKTIERIINIDR